MKILIPPIYESLENIKNPFSLDSFGRSEFAKNLTNTFRNSSDGLVLTINSKWGDGKTTFIKLWEYQLLKEEVFIPIYYDAYKNDFSGDAFLSIASLIHQTLNEKLDKDDTDKKQQEQLKVLKKKAISLSKELLKMGTTTALNSIMVSHFVPKKLSDFLSKQFVKIGVDVFRTNVDEKYEAHINSQVRIQEYKDKLKEILSHSNENIQYKIVFFVDELDRCRPDFAIQVIEKIKHLFDIDNVFFVLAINREQLISTIRSVYGVNDEDGRIYLQKFVHVETNLPAMNASEKSNEQLKKHLIKLAKAIELNKYFSLISVNFDALTELVSDEYLSLNPRGIERMFSLIALGIGSQDNIGEKIVKGISISEDELFKMNDQKIEEDNTETSHFKIKTVLAMSALRIGSPDTYFHWREGRFYKNTNSTKLWEWFVNYFEGQSEQQASNVYAVKGVKNICDILDIYQFPVENEYFFNERSNEVDLSTPDVTTPVSGKATVDKK